MNEYIDSNGQIDVARQVFAQQGFVGSAHHTAAERLVWSVFGGRQHLIYYNVPMPWSFYKPLDADKALTVSIVALNCDAGNRRSAFYVTARKIQNNQIVEEPYPPFMRLREFMEKIPGKDIAEFFDSLPRDPKLHENLKTCLNPRPLAF